MSRPFPRPVLETDAMTASLRLFVASAIVAVALTACGTGPTEVNTASPINASAAAAPVQEDAPTTTAAPKVKTTPLVDLKVLSWSDPVLSGSVKMNGTVYDNAAYVQRCNSDAVFFYDLNRSYTRLTSTVGLDDRTVDPEEPEFTANQEFKGAVTITIKADGIVKSTLTPKVGAPVPLELDVTNVLRLRIDIKGGWACWPAAGFSTIVAFGDAQLTPKAA